MNDLEKYEAVNSCETFEELAEVVKSFAVGENLIEGRTRDFDAERVIDHILNFKEHVEHAPNVLTRRFGIRQQAMYIAYYTR